MTAYLAAEARAERQHQRDTLLLLRASQADAQGFQAVWDAVTED